MNPLPANEIEEVRQKVPGFENKNIILAGSGGFLGRWIYEVLSPICKIRALDLNLGFDITDPNRVGLIDGKIDFIIHAAGFASPKNYRKNPLKTIDVSVRGTENLLKLSTRLGSRMLFFSSSEIYGNPTIVPTPEWYKGSVDCRGPRACYDESKRLGETLCQVYFETRRTKVVTVRPFNVYGPGMDFNDGRAIPAFANSIFNKSLIDVFGNGKSTRTYCYVTDAVVGFLKALLYGQEGRVYNIGSDDVEISAFDLATKIKQICLSEVEIISGSYPEGYPSDEPERRKPDLKRAKEELGYKPEILLDDGIRKHLKWAEII